MTFSDRMVELARATDADGVPLTLYHGNWSADSLRDASKEFARTIGLNAGSMEFLGFNLAQSMDPQRSRLLEANAFENLAKLLNATAAAIREGR